MSDSFHYPRLPFLARLPINFATTGDHIIVPADATRRIVIHRLWFVCGATLNLTFKDNMPSPAPVPMGVDGALVFDTSGEPWFVTDPAIAFIISSDADGQVSGEVRYTLAL